MNVSIGHSAAAIAERLQIRKVRNRHAEWRGACPACGYSDGLVLSERDRKALWWCASCQDGKAVGAAIRRAMGDADWTAPASIVAPERTSPAVRIARAMVTWGEGVPIEGTLAERYLGRRGVLHWWNQFPREAYPGWAPALRFHPACIHPGGRGVRLPALLALVTALPSGDAVGIHRTYLSADGSRKADAIPAKASLGPVKGGVVMLQPPVGDAPLIVAEGIETALAAGHLMHAPAWAAISAGNLSALAPPQDVDNLVIAADPDRPGQRAAWSVARRWRTEGKAVRVATPDYADQDFADVLRERLARAAVAHG